jgi:adenylate cyclase class 2
MGTHMEGEVKLRFPDADAARAAVGRAGATPLRGRRLQDDRLLDTPDETLRKRQCVLRVRIEPAQSAITFKGPVQPSVVKLREELETAVVDGLVALRIVESLGYRVWFRYQKHREEFTWGGDVVIAVDETPVGTFVEIEGREDRIAETAAALGRGPSDYILDSYRGLYISHCKARGIQPAHMTFDA